MLQVIFTTWSLYNSSTTSLYCKFVILLRQNGSRVLIYTLDCIVDVTVSLKLNFVETVQATKYGVTGNIQRCHDENQYFCMRFHLNSVNTL